MSLVLPENTHYPFILLKLTSHFPAQNSTLRSDVNHCPQQTCFLSETTWHSGQHDWSWEWPEWASKCLPLGSTRRRYDQFHRWRCDCSLVPSQCLINDDMDQIVLCSHDALRLCRSDEPPELTCHLPIVLFQHMNFAPVVCILFVDMDFMVIRTQCDF